MKRETPDTGGKRSSEEVISPIGSENPKTYNNKLLYKSYMITAEIERLCFGWRKILDIVSYNINFNLKIRTIEPNILESITNKIKTVKNIVSPNSADALIKDYGELIVGECNRYKLDWRIVLSIIRQESYFNSEAVSRAGAYGFMQIMPRTGSGLQSELALEDTRQPRNNLIAGIYYYASLVATFEFLGEDKYKFALASYNAGLGRVVDAMTITHYFGKDYRKWDNVKESLPYLASNQDSVHALVWPGSKRPPSGALNNWIEPYKYVEYIVYFYQEYSKIFESNLEIPKQKKEKRKKKK